MTIGESLGTIVTNALCVLIGVVIGGVLVVTGVRVEQDVLVAPYDGGYADGYADGYLDGQEGYESEVDEMSYSDF